MLLSDPKQAAREALRNTQHYAKLLLHRHRMDAEKYQIDINTGIIRERKKE